MKEEINALIHAFKLDAEEDKKLSPAEREIKHFLKKEIPKIQKIHDQMIDMLEKHYREDMEKESYLHMLFLECTWIQSMLCRFYGIETPLENIQEDLKNANL